MSQGMDFEEFTEQLASFNAIFYTAWKMGSPVFSDMVPTAAVLFDKKGQEIMWTFNPTFWGTLNDREKAFIFCHEVLHIVLHHGKRTIQRDKDGVAKAIDDYRTNVALDIVVNEMLIATFGFEHDELPNLMAMQVCFIDTIFGRKTRTVKGEEGQPDIEVPNLLYNPDVKREESFEYYYNKLAQLGDEKNWTIIDDHSQLGGSGHAIAADELDDKVENTLDDESKKKLGGKLAGTEFGNHLMKMYVTAIKKKKWETVIKKWVQKAMRDFELERWSPKARRTQHLHSDLHLPSVIDADSEERDKINLYFLLDTSGSCSHLAERFFRAAKSVPTERFNIRLLCFDTQVYEVKNNELQGFGGTCFVAIEKWIQQEMKNGKKYPDAVFLITDGAGTNVTPQYPTRWHWFLSEDYRNCIPATSKIYMLSDFE